VDLQIRLATVKSSVSFDVVYLRFFSVVTRSSDRSSTGVYNELVPLHAVFAALLLSGSSELAGGEGMMGSEGVVVSGERFSAGSSELSHGRRRNSSANARYVIVKVSLLVGQ